ncbi:hypothetical protein [Terriglobus albidus]|uniref:hypothetical protein n=1 Tax=Terriglobus albidus TaxID=1592106 RepID=UPI0021E0CFC8|nr:hypothetical protein [Terriglobus albidus]
MSMLRQINAGERRTWMRWVAVLCMLLIMVASTVELCHTHPDSVQQTRDQRQSGPTDHCPLCVAMHSALPTSLHVTPEPVMQVGTVQGPAIDTRRRLLWAHGLASRPPPSVTTIAL